MKANNYDAIARLALLGLISQIRKTISLTYTVPMHLLSEAYHTDYREEMVPVKELEKYLKELESILDGCEE